jgi:prepilin-type N-terminal cleavage/methylation domain-containing protein
MRYPVRTKTKAGFTLIELLVVIAILAILMGLVTAGVIKYLDNIPKTQTVNDINQLGMAMETFKSKYGVYPPSTIFLSNIQADFAAAPNGPASLAYLSAIWPRLNWSAGIDWSGGQGVIPAGGITLEGDQCLVFFLNGPGGANAAGWSINPTNPTQAGGPRVGPFFEFPLDRLLPYPHPATSQPAAVSAMFPSFWDRYAVTSVSKGKPYAFFCSGRSAGGYGPHCPSLGVIPYVQNNGQFYRNNSLQIISAGKDMNFGPGGPWPPSATNGGNIAAYTNGFGVDDLANFSGDMLGVY